MADAEFFVIEVEDDDTLTAVASNQARVAITAVYDVYGKPAEGVSAMHDYTLADGRRLECAGADFLRNVILYREVRFDG